MLGLNSKAVTEIVPAKKYLPMNSTLSKFSNQGNVNHRSGIFSKKTAVFQTSESFLVGNE